MRDKDKIKSQTSNYEYTPYTESQAVTNKRNELNQLTKPQNQGFSMQEQLDDTMKQIFDRKEFDYDINGDALYQQYKNNYAQQGKLAAQDVMGQASKMTGGYGNSWASTASNQAYQSSLQQLNDIVPELYQLAYNRYQSEGDALLNRYNMLTGREATEYGLYRDQLADYYNQYGLISNEEDKLYNREYGAWMDAENIKNSIAQSDRDYQYQVGRDTVADQQWKQQFDYAQNRDNIADQQWQQQFNYAQNRDSVADKQWQQQFDYAQERDSVADKQWDKTYNYQASRDKIADNQWQQQFDASEDDIEFQRWLSQQNLQLNQDQLKHNKEMDYKNHELASKQYQLELGEQRMAREEHEMLMEQYEKAKETGTVSDYIGKITPVDIANTISAFRLDNDKVGLEAFISDLADRGIITEQQYLDYCDMFEIEE